MESSSSAETAALRAAGRVDCMTFNVKQFSTRPIRGRDGGRVRQRGSERQRVTDRHSARHPASQPDSKSRQTDEDSHWQPHSLQ